MKQAILIALQIVAGCVLWVFALVLWMHWLPFKTDYGDYSRIEAKGIAIEISLFVLAQYAAFSLRRRLSK
jgi:hypothetical protein